MIRIKWYHGWKKVILSLIQVLYINSVLLLTLIRPQGAKKHY